MKIVQAGKSLSLVILNQYVNALGILCQDLQRWHVKPRDFVFAGNSNTKVLNLNPRGV
jgi:hypothetical protein